MIFSDQTPDKSEGSRKSFSPNSSQPNTMSHVDLTIVHYTTHLLAVPFKVPLEAQISINGVPVSKV